MRPKFSFSNIIAIAALGALAVMAATDPRFRELLTGNWPWIGLLLGLIVLVMAQVIMVRRRLYVLPAGRTHLAEPATPQVLKSTFQPPPPKPRKDAAGTAGTSAPAVDVENPSDDPRSGEGQDPTDGKDSTEQPGPGIDRNLFTRFQQHLESVEKQNAQTPGPNRAPASEEDVVDRVELSSASRRKAPPGGRAGKKDSGAGKKTASGPGTYAAFVGGEGDQDGPDLFSDLRPQPVTPPSDEDTSGDGQEAANNKAGTGVDSVVDSAESPHPPPEPPEDLPAAKKSTGIEAKSTTEAANDERSENGESGDTTVTADPVATDATDASAADSRDERGLEGRTPPPGDYHPPPDEVTDEVTEALAARAGDSPEKGRAELAEEAAALLNLAEEAGRNGVWERLRACLENYLAHLAEAPELVDWRARRLQVRLTVHDRTAGPALQAFEEMLTAGYRPEVDDVPGLLEELLDGGERKLADTLRVSMLVRILAAFRQRRDQPAMDHAYTWIEAAQERVGDEKRLLEYLKNHLDIRKAMGNAPGQLELIDQIGNRCFKLGLTEEAKTYYEMGLKLRGESEADQAPTGDDGSAVG